MTARTRLRRGCALFSLALAAAALTAPGAQAGEAEADAGTHRARLIEEALTRHLDEDPTWHALLHYRGDWIGAGVTSYADGDAFFLSPSGKTDPRAELVATIERLFDPPAPPGERHTQCRFIARHHWLREVLSIDPAALPVAPCPAFDEWFGALDPQGLTLVFPDAFMNNPASAFGHTLLRIDSRAPGSDADLAAYSLNFGAVTDGEGGLVYTLKGLVGGYPGYFSVAPYYDKVEEYGDWENRDIWEYPLAFTEPEVRRILEHAWELEGVDFDYYYLDENCSLVLLRLLEVARPATPLDPRWVLPWVLPVDVVRVMLREVGRPDEIRYRASPATGLRHAAQRTPVALQRMAQRLSHGELATDDAALDALSPDDHATVLALAHDDLRYRFLANEVERPEALGRTRRLLVALSQVDNVPERVEPPEPAAHPEDGHRTPRFALTGGVLDDDAFVELRARAGFHDLIDPPAGHTKGAAITFLEGAIRYLPERDGFRLHELVALDVVSLSPRNTFLSPISWRFSTALRTRLLLTDDGALRQAPVWRTDGGIGLAYDDLVPGLRLYGLAELGLDVGSDLDGDVAAGPGAVIGALAGGADDVFTFHLFARATGYALGETTERYQAGAALGVPLGSRFALRFETEYVRVYGEDRVDAAIGLSFFP